jgi:16S rRNA (uracil1498-N3)-methyltransferase
MHRFRVERIGDGDRIWLGDAGQVHHLKDVLRLAAGDEVEMFDDGGQECLCAVERLERASVTLSVKSRREASRRRARLMVACSLPKKGMDEIVDKLTQLGVDTIVPMRTERVVVKLGDQAARARVERWRRLARAAAEQSQRSDVPEVGPVTDFGQIVSQAGGFDLKLIPTLSGDRKTIVDIVAGSRPASILVLIGPEGDFTDQELETARKAGFLPVSLGDQVLRVDTAAIAVASYLRVAGVT